MSDATAPAADAELESFEAGKSIEVDWRKIESELSKLWRKASQHTPGRVVSRACLWNLLTLVPASSNTDDGMVAYRQLIDQIAAQVACRVIGIAERPVPESSGGDVTQIRAFVEANWRHVPGQWNGSDEVLIVADKRQRGRLESLATSLLVADAATALLALGQHDPERSYSEQLVNAVDRLIVDSRFFQTANDMAQVHAVISGHPRLQLADLSWLATSPLRGLVASLFDHPEEVKYLDQLDSIRVTTGIAGLPSRALLFLGWLASRLGYKDLAPVSGSVLEMGTPRWTAKDAHGRVVNLALDRTTGVAVGVGHGITEIRLNAKSESGACEWTVRRTDGGIEVHSPRLPPRIQPARSRSMAELVAAALGPRGVDPAYRAALEVVHHLVRGVS